MTTQCSAWHIPSPPPAMNLVCSALQTPSVQNLSLYLLVALKLNCAGAEKRVMVYFNQEVSQEWRGAGPAGTEDGAALWLPGGIQLELRMVPPVCSSTLLCNTRESAHLTCFIGQSLILHLSVCLSICLAFWLNIELSFSARCISG